MNRPTVIVFVCSLMLAATAAADINGDLRKAAEKGDLAKVQAILNKAASSPSEKLDLNAVDGNGTSALWFAASEGHEAVVKLLLERGAAADARGKWGRGPDKQVFRPTPLITAAGDGYTSIVNLLIAHGADVNAVARRSYFTDDCKDTQTTALVQAAARGRAEAAKVLIEKGANVHVESALGCTPLIVALREQDDAEHRYSDVVTMLLEKGAKTAADVALLLWPSGVVLTSFDGQATSINTPGGMQTIGGNPMISWNNDGSLKALGKGFLTEPDGGKTDLLLVQQRQFLRLTPGAHKLVVAFGALSANQDRVIGTPVPLEVTAEAGKRFVLRYSVDKVSKKWTPRIEEHR